MNDGDPVGGAAANSVRRPRGPFVLLICAIAAAVIIGVVVASGGGVGQRTPPSASEAAEAAPAAPAEPDPSITAPATDQTITDDGASTTVAALLDAVSVIGGDPQRSAATLGNIATGAILEEIEADSEELEANGWTRVGVPIVERATVLASEASSATIEACVDSSDVEIRDAAGTPIPRDAATARSLNLYTLEFDGTAWRVSARTFPDDAAC